ncbi:MAG: DUF3604 domain-containing protein [Candidatus Lokiarchaeota archaeon]|nr:DUF3604 domain-containing protein [Candidatus Lokiarchaeota archaeon]
MEYSKYKPFVKVSLKTNHIRIQNLHIDPEHVVARTQSNIKFKFNLNTELPAGSFLEIRLRGGRTNKNDWYFLQPYSSKEPGYVRLRIKNYHNFLPLIKTGKELSISYFFYGRESVKKGELFQFEIYNTLVQSLAEKKKVFEVILKLPNKKAIKLSNSPVLEVINDKLNNIRILAPSTVFKGDKFQSIVRIEDQYCNLVRDFSKMLNLYLIDGKNSDCFLRQLVFSKSHSGISNPKDIEIEKSGLYKLRITYKGQNYYSNPILCTEYATEKKLFWGVIHGHTKESDGILSLEEYFKNLKSSLLNFGTSTEHDHGGDLLEDNFAKIKKISKSFCEDNKFITFFGYEWGTWFSGYGDICIYHYDNTIPVFSSKINKCNSTAKLIKHLKPYKEEVLMIGHHTALRPGYRNWDFLDNSLENLVEIYSTWGNQEYSFQNGNPLPPRYKFFGYGSYARRRGAILEKKGSFVKDALLRGYKIGFTAGGDDHFGVFPSGPIDPDNGIYPSGIMAIWAPNLSKKSIWKAMKHRHCYGTTGPRLILKFFVNNHEMGEIIDIKNHLELKNKRILNLQLISPVMINKIEIIRNGLVFKVLNVKSSKIKKEVVDSEPFHEIKLNHTKANEEFIFYYLRVFLENNNMAWSSPIWIVC